MTKRDITNQVFDLVNIDYMKFADECIKEELRAQLPKDWGVGYFKGQFVWFFCAYVKYKNTLSLEQLKKRSFLQEIHNSEYWLEQSCARLMDLLKMIFHGDSKALSSTIKNWKKFKSICKLLNKEWVVKDIHKEIRKNRRVELRVE